jgi:hypothetical protein
MSHLSQLSLAYVIGHLMCHKRPAMNGFQCCREGVGVGGVGQVLSRPSADSFDIIRPLKATAIHINDL